MKEAWLVSSGRGATDVQWVLVAGVSCRLDWRVVGWFFFVFGVVWDYFSDGSVVSCVKIVQLLLFLLLLLLLLLHHTSISLSIPLEPGRQQLGTDKIYDNISPQVHFRCVRRSSRQI